MKISQEYYIDAVCKNKNNLNKNESKQHFRTIDSNDNVLKSEKIELIITKDTVKNSYFSSNSRFLSLNDINDKIVKSPVMNIRNKNINHKRNKYSENSLEFGRKSKDNTYLSFQPDHKKMIRQISKLCSRLENIEIKINENEFKKKIQKQWMMMAKIIDRFLLYFFSISFCITVTVISIQMPKQL